jgi:hypothetical protein
MAQLFTVLFHYKEQTYTAVISLTHHNGEQATTIHLPDESLHHILGSSAFSYETAKGIPLDYPDLSPSQDLLVCILAAMEQHGEQLQLNTPKNQSS